MKALMALLCLCPLACAAATKIQTCTTTPNASGPNALVGCPTKNLVWGPNAATDLVRVIKSGNSQGWIPFNTLTPSTQVVPQTGGWATFGSLTVVVPSPPVVPPVQTTHVYVLVWDAVTKNVDGSTLTDLTGYVAQTGPSVAGPWGGSQSISGTTTSFVLPSNVQQCFQVVAISQAGGSSDPARICAAPIPAVTTKPSPPANVKAN